LDPRISVLAQNMTEGARSDAEAAQLLEEKLRRDYAYSLELPRQAPADPLADFLFVRKKGYCEYFASAMAVMLRTLSIPSRVVTGFQSGVFNPMTGAQLVRASDAHSWVEAWIEGSGWTTFDPTPADPQAPPPDLTGISMWMDAADQFWRNWVVSYDLPRQSALAVRIRQGGETLGLPALSAWISTLGAAARRIAGSHRAWMFVGAVCGAILTFAIWSVVRNLWLRRAEVRRLERGEGHPSDATMLYRRMLGLLERRGFPKPAHATPSEFARALPVSEMSMLVEDLTSAYNRFRFGGRGDLAPHIIRLLERLENLQAHAGKR
jgi:protein-glutamine gamma-glutamyltransferase